MGRRGRVEMRKKGDTIKKKKIMSWTNTERQKDKMTKRQRDQEINR